MIAKAPLSPLSAQQHEQILMAHGGGGTLTHALINDVFMTAFDNPLLAAQHDGAVFTVAGNRLAATTDSFVVQPLFFPGGDIGSLAVHGTVNDLTMCGARPLYLTAGFIIEEGLSVDVLQRIVNSMASAARLARVQIIAGDTKVVDRGKGDGVFINTAGIGVVPASIHIAAQRIRPGDAIIVSGDIARHGVAIMAQREGLTFDSTITSDAASVNGVVQKVLDRGIDVHCMRDLTRGGLSSALNEIATAVGHRFDVRESALPVHEDVRGACELLGLDPMYVACEGRFVLFCKAEDCAAVLETLHADPLGQKANVVGTVTHDNDGIVTVVSPIGVRRIADMLSGEQLPRIC
jgi:hydrogenase expression/formation protein HypE